MITLLTKTFRSLCILGFALAVQHGPTPATAHEAPIRVVVVGEDSDPNAVPRNNEIYKRVVAELQQSLLRENITVIDEDMIAVKLGFNFESQRNKQELLQTLSVANETTDATVQSRLGFIFAVFPNVQEMEFTRKVTVRVRGQIYDLKSLQALSSFEVETAEAITVPKKDSLCNDVCLLEAIGEHSKTLARELGAVLNTKLHILVESGQYPGLLQGTAEPQKTAVAGDGVLMSVYTVKFILLDQSDVLRTVSSLEKSHVREIELLKSSGTERIYSVTTNKNLGDFESLIMNILLAQGLDLKRLRFTAFGSEIVIEAL
jgi:hypothetical protein